MAVCQSSLHGVLVGKTRRDWVQTKEQNTPRSPVRSRRLGIGRRCARVRERRLGEQGSVGLGSARPGKVPRAAAKFPGGLAEAMEEEGGEFEHGFVEFVETAANSPKQGDFTTRWRGGRRQLKVGQGGGKGEPLGGFYRVEGDFARRRDGKSWCGNLSKRQRGFHTPTSQLWKAATRWGLGKERARAWSICIRKGARMEGHKMDSGTAAGSGQLGAGVATGLGWRSAGVSGWGGVGLAVCRGARLKRCSVQVTWVAGRGRVGLQQLGLMDESLRLGWSDGWAGCQVGSCWIA